MLTHWGRVTHICVGKLTIIGSDNGLSPGRLQAIIRTNAGILLIGTSGTNFREILSEIHTFSFKKMSSGKWRPFCLGLHVLTFIWEITCYKEPLHLFLPLIIHWITKEVRQTLSCWTLIKQILKFLRHCLQSQSEATPVSLVLCTL